MPLPDCLARAAERDDAVHGWAYLDRDAQGGDGPLAGMVVGVKDVIDVAGMPTTHGSPIYRDTIALRDARAVCQLRKAGAVILGKTVTAEFATYHPGPTVNPRKAGHTPGGSSSGSAAVVADGQADLALGTQTAGSIIRPASFCGTLGFKPSFGRYPLEGVLETSPHLDTLGLFARRLDVLGVADTVISGDDETPEATPCLTIGVMRSPAWDEADAEMGQTLLGFAQKLAEAGHKVIERDLPEPFSRLASAQTLIHEREAWDKLGHIRNQHPGQVSAAFAAMMDRGAAHAQADYEQSLQLQRTCIALAGDIFSGVDMLLTPGATGAAPKGLDSTGNPAFQRIWTAIGTPCLGFPADRRADGLPLGLQIVGPYSHDRRLLANAGTIITLAAMKES